MDFTPAEAQRELAALTRLILASSESPWKDLAEAGVLAATLPSSVDGAGHGLLEQCAILGELGRAAYDSPYLDTIVLGAAGIAAFGAPSQVESWAVPATRGDLIVAVAFDVTVAYADGILAGTASGVRDSDVLLVPTPSGAVVILPSDAGVDLTPQNVGGFPRLFASFDGVRGRLLPGLTTSWLRDRAVVGRCAYQVGVLERAVELTAAYAAERVQFGRPIGAFQAVRQRLADAYVDVEAARLSLWQAAWRLSEGLSAAEEIAIAKFWAADAGHRVAHTAVHLHGGVGVDVSHPIHRYFLAAKDTEYALGGATAHLLALGELLAPER